MSNKKRLYQVLDAIITNPKHWNQAKWHCNTSHCFAGFAQLIKHNLSISTEIVFDHTSSDDDADIALVNEKELRIGLAADVAREYLDLTYDEASSLFHYENSLEDLQEAIIQIVGER